MILINSSLLFDDLVQIFRCDAGLDWIDYTDPISYQQYMQVTYTDSGSGGIDIPTQVINSSGKVVITAVDEEFIVPDDPNPATGKMWQNGGATTDGRGYPDIPIAIYLDTTDASNHSNGYGYCVLDSQGKKISAPQPVSLYHELAHAYLWINGTTATDEQRHLKALQYENAFRARLGLPQRDVGTRKLENNAQRFGPPDYGPPFPQCSGSGFKWGWNPCAIATAAVGSPYAPAVARLRQAKHDYRNLSRWIGHMVERVLVLYERFSPLVVREMGSDSRLKNVILLYLVQPAVHFLDLFELYVASESDDRDLLARLDRCVSAYLSEVADANGSEAALRAAAHGAADASRRLWPKNSTPVAQPSREQIPDDLFNYLASVIAASGHDTSGYAWLLEGLALFLHYSGARLANDTTLDQDALTELDAWLARLPIPADAGLSITDTAEELCVLSERFFTAKSARELFAKRLLSSWPDRSTTALESLLNDLGYIKPSRL